MNTVCVDVSPGDTAGMSARGFTLIELLVVVAIIALLIGILLPSLTAVRQRAIKTACAAGLRQVGMGVDMYRDAFGDRYPEARYMPPPFISSDTDPPLPVVLKSYLPTDSKVFICPGDRDYVHPLTGISYTYNNSLSGRQLDESWFTRRLQLDVTEVPVSYDCDGNRFALNGGETITVPWFHLRRNLLFADGHVGNY